MSTYPNPFGGPAPRRPQALDYATGTSNDAAVRFFNAVYGWMAAGLALTAVVAWWISSQPQLVAQVFRGPVLIGLVIAQLVLVGVVSAAVNRISAPVATALFLAYAALNGLTFSALFLIYTTSSLTSAFAISAGTFGAVSVYGMVTRRDLSSLGSILFMGLIGIIIASVVNIFFLSSTLSVIINYVGVLLFVGLTAYDAQRMKYMAAQTAGNPAMAARLSIVGALALYLDFINLFIFILRILGKRR